MIAAPRIDPLPADLAAASVDDLVRDADVELVRVYGAAGDELDLLDTKARRVRLADVRLGHLSVRDGALQDVDLRGASIDAIDGLRHLRGATIDADQLVLMAPLMADALGLRVES